MKMKFYNQNTHRSVTINSSEINISGTRAYRKAGVCAIAVHGKSSIPLNEKSDRCRRMQTIVTDNHRKDWERKFKELA
jgi:hypothetical protein